MAPLRVVFMGTPEAAVPSLRAVAEAFDVAAVYTRPDRPRGRGRRLEPSPVKVAAGALDLPVRQPDRLRDDADALRALAPDAIAVVAYGAILRPDVLALPRLGCVNVHFSLLPRWRGAAPVERAIIAGDERTGVTTMLMDEGLDTGPILRTEVTPIGDADTAGDLRESLAAMGAPLLVSTLRDLEAGTAEPVTQDEEGATTAPKLDPAEARLDPWREDAPLLARKVRAFNPAPGAFVLFRGKRLKIWRAHAADGTLMAGAFDAGGIGTPDGRLVLDEVQPEGKRRMDGEAFFRGYRPRTDDLSATV